MKWVREGREREDWGKTLWMMVFGRVRVDILSC